MSLPIPSGEAGFHDVAAKGEISRVESRHLGKDYRNVVAGLSTKEARDKLRTEVVIAIVSVIALLTLLGVLMFLM